MNPLVIAAIWDAIKYVISKPIVKVAIDNWTKGTSNKIDDLVWKMLKIAAGIKDEISRKEFVISESSRIQELYNEAKTTGELIALKSAIRDFELAGSLQELDNIA